MRWILYAGWLIVFLSLAGPAAAADCRWPFSRWCCPWCPSLRPCAGCPDDYCPKAWPPVLSPAPCCKPDDYCPKAMPRVPCCVKYGPDEYCPKECPPIPKLCWPPWYTCGPGSKAPR